MHVSQSLAETPEPEATAQSYKFDAFASYSTDPDAKLVRRIEAYLERFHELKLEPGMKPLRKLAICVDGSDFYLPPGDRREKASAPSSPVESVIEDNLRESRFLLLFCSSRSARSKWVDGEVRWFLESLQHEKEETAARLSGPADGVVATPTRERMRVGQPGATTSGRPVRAVLLAVTEGEDPEGHPEEVFSARVREAGLNAGIWFELRGRPVRSWRSLYLLRRAPKKWRKLRSYDEELVRLAAYLNDRAVGDVLPSWLVDQRQRQRRRRAIIAGVVALIAAASLVATRSYFIAYAESTSSAARGLLGDDPEMAIRIAGESLRTASNVLATGPANAEDVARAATAELKLPSRLGAAKPVTTAAWSDDGSRVLALAGTTITVWDAEHGVPVAEPIEVGDSVARVKFGADGDVVVAIVSTDIVRMWRQQGARWEQVGDDLHVTGVQDVAGHPNGRVLVAGGLDGTVSVWESGVPGRPLDGPGGSVTSVDFDHTGERLVGASGSKLRVWNLSTREPERDLTAPGWVDSVSFAPDDRYLVAAMRGDGALLFDVKSGENRKFPHPKLTSVTVSRRGDLLATAAKDGRVWIWRIEDQFWLSQLGLQNGEVTAVDFSPKDELVTAGSDGAKLWTLRPPHLQTVVQEGTVTTVAFESQHEQLAIGDSNDQARVWAVDRGTEEDRLDQDAHSGRVTSVVFSRDGALLMTTSRDGTAHFWAPRTGPALRWNHQVAAPVGNTLSPHQEPVVKGGLRQDGEIAFTFDAHSAYLWTVPQGTAIRALPHGDATVHAAAFSTGGDELLTAGSDGLRWWSLAAAAEARGPAPAGASWTLAEFHCSGTLLAASETHAWIVASDSGEAQALPDHDQPINGLAWNCPERQAATLSGDTIRVWDAGSRTLSIDPLHHAGVKVAAFGNDGLLATGADDGSVIVWDTRTGARVVRFNHHNEKAITSLAFDADNAFLATGGMDGTVAVYARELFIRFADLPRLWSERGVRVDLTEDERERYLPARQAWWKWG